MSNNHELNPHSRIEIENEMYERSVSWIMEAGEIIKARMLEKTEYKQKTSHSDVVTEVDRQVEAFLVNKINEYYPEHNIIGEENIGNRASSSPYVWIIDPIDGTSNFINRKQDFAISVALCEQERGVFGIIYDVMAEKFYCARQGNGAYLNDRKLSPPEADGALENELMAINAPWGSIEEMKRWEHFFRLGPQVRGVRNYGATTMELGDMAAGLLGGYVQYYVNSWDYAAGRIILEELGYTFSDLQGRAIDRRYCGGIIAASPAIHRQIIQALQKAAE
ncbi:inositol monophosphatase family protein [Paenibacillus sp. NPDC058071]|uniref:inositol monophosphatase family protein n=1 Tax=Paenibacillus sp. NPDC058071 TaxID=3346326 RepID=UPI0036DD148F